MKRSEETATGRRARARADTGPVEVDAEVRDPVDTTAPGAIPVPSGPQESASAPDAPEGAPGARERTGGERRGRRADRGPSSRTLKRDEIRERLNTAVNGFVDDPGKSVGEADALAGDVTEALIARVEARRAELRAAWEDGADTERLRMALRDYRTFVDGVLDGRLG